MKKIIILFPLLVSTFITACDVVYCPYCNEKSLTVGDTWDYREGLTIRFDSCDYWIDELETSLYFELTFTINTTNEYTLIKEDMYCYVVLDEKIYSIVEKNIELNGYNIFDIIVTEETQYTFYFEVSLDEYFKDENGDIKHGNWGTHCHIEPANFDITLTL